MTPPPAEPAPKMMLNGKMNPDYLAWSEQARLTCGTCGRRLRDHIEGVSGHAFVRTLTPPPAEPSLDVDDWNNIMEALEVASSYPQEMQVNRERWVATLARVESRAPAEPTLDVERLDAALDRLNVGAAGWPTADAIAREYARLATEDKPA